ncbi:helix-turn-helix domain-containing protein [Sphingomonas sp. SUN039]|uniref:helix-turn-helix domain-containing protein n=1 Tax=Sphingomonas sp. SUN039 TaxID=2937787 RepID=UPI002164CD84|nr:helix-turn-helix transcriptional regulator [Sphingomonas sp. SUN039]UVO53059.1 helix-turn-helix transcriptional regulator [Sphingomonas sp. SUN039]
MPYSRKSAFEQPYIDIIDRLIARRQELGITQADLGAMFGDTQSAISKIERRQRRLDVYEFVRFCRALQIAPDEILRPLYEGQP